MYYLIWAGRLFHAVWCQLRWRPFGGFTGWELEGWQLVLTVDWLLDWNRWPKPKDSPSYGLSMWFGFFPAWFLFQEKGSRSCRPVRTWAHKWQNITFTASDYPLSHEASLNSWKMKINSASQWGGSIHTGTQRIKVYGFGTGSLTARYWNDSSDWNRHGRCVLSRGWRE